MLVSNTYLFFGFIYRMLNDPYINCYKKQTYKDNSQLVKTKPAKNPYNIPYVFKSCYNLEKWNTGIIVI